MNRRFFIQLLAVMPTAFSAHAAQQAKKVPLVGFLIASSPSSQQPRLEAFKRGLRERGYVEGQNTH